MSFYTDRQEISKAYHSIYESECRRGRRSTRNYRKYGINEDNNVVYRVQGPSTSELEEIRAREEQKRRDALTPEERGKEDEERARVERRRARIQREYEAEIARRRRLQEREYNQKHLVTGPEIPDRVDTIGPADSFGAAQIRAAASTDPGMRIGKGVYDGIGYMSPLGMLTKGSKAAKVAKNCWLECQPELWQEKDVVILEMNSSTRSTAIICRIYLQPRSS